MGECSMRNGTSPLEIERKFLIRYPDISWLSAQPGSRCAELTQTYLRSDGRSSRRVRAWTENGRTVWYHTAKRMVTDVTREEIENEISEGEYLALLQEADPARHPIRKLRWCLPYEGHMLEIDLYPFWEKQAVLECELGSEDERFSIPPEISVLREVTGDPQYLNSSMARAIPAEDL